MAGSAWQLRSATPYSLYVLALLLMAYLLNQLDRYALAIVAVPMSQEVHFGDHGCLKNDSFTDDQFGNITCKKLKNETSCLTQQNLNGSFVCKWDYNGQGLEYQIVAGPVFILIFTFMGVILGFAADKFNRKILLAVCLIFWSIMTLLTGFVKEYWQLVLLRFGLGMGEAGCTPFASSLIADYFEQDLRASALGVYNWGIYMGYSLSYAIGNFITEANINGQGWRWTFFICGIPGLLFGLLIMFSMKEPQRKSNKNEIQTPSIQGANTTLGQRLLSVLKPFLSPSLMLLCLAGSIRNAGGYVWAYNTQPYFEAIDQTPDQIGKFMSWIPLVGGSLGVVLGGFISDLIVKRKGPHARIIVLVVSQLLAAPFAAGALFLKPPYAYISLIPSNIIGEMWVGVTLAVVIELVPTRIRTSAVAVYLFIISNIGGNVPLLVPPIQQAFEDAGSSKTDGLRYALYILFPGLYVLGAGLFLLTLFLLKRDLRRIQQLDFMPLKSDDTDDDVLDRRHGSYGSANSSPVVGTSCIDEDDDDDKLLP